LSKNRSSEDSGKGIAIMSAFFALPNDILELIYEKKHRMEWRAVLAGERADLNCYTSHLIPGEIYKLNRNYKFLDNLLYLRSTKAHYVFLKPDGKESKFSRTAKNPLQFESKKGADIRWEIHVERLRQWAKEGF
jgi:hypothetical protein